MKIKINIKIIFASIPLLILVSCQEGLEPSIKDIKQDITSFIIGDIIYKGGIDNFPDSSKCFGVYAAAFKKYPSDSAGIIKEVLSGNVYMKFESLPYPSDSSRFEIEISNPPVNIEYLVIAMQTDSVNIESQRAIGVYTESGDNTKPSIISIDKRDSIFVKILVDFDNLPPQPFE